ncbi:MAG: peptidoglycan DD-metalloendopeptidase family protein [Salinibacter sp.]
MTLLPAMLGALLLAPLVAPGGPGTPQPEAASATEAFGLPTEKYAVERGQVARYQTFADILTAHGGAYRDAVRLARAVRPAFDVRDLRPGQSYRVYINPWLQRVRYLVYQIDAVHYVVFDVQRPARSRVGRRAVKREWTVVQDTIDNSLYETLTTNDIHPKLALRLSEVFAWQIDFFRIRAGDSFRVLYERRFVEGKQVAPGKIIAARFTHQGRHYYGVRFDDGQGPQYFNREGESLRRTLLKAPLRYSRISSGYSRSRVHPVLNRRRPHLGTDYAAPTGTPVHSVGSGTVLKAGHYGPNGNYVKIRHNGVYTTGYLHLTAIADGIEPGAEVRQGETIGYVGSTGLSTGPHLDYRLWKRGTAVDPYEIEPPPTRPVSPQHRTAFRRLVEDRLRRLFPLRAFRRRVPGPSAVGGTTASAPQPRADDNRRPMTGEGLSVRGTR